MMIDVNEICKNYFPYSSPRESQINAIEKILNAFLNGKRYFTLEAGTGVGKSAIAYTVARYINEKTKDIENYINGTYFITSQKILQEQYIKDFGKLNMKSIFSSKNYNCKKNLKKTCCEIQTELRSTNNNVPGFESCSYDCVYKLYKKEFIESNLSVTNFPYIMTESNYSGKIKPRKLLIIDEAHNIETELSKFIEISVSEHFAKLVLKLSMPKLETQFQAYKWIVDIYYPKLKSHYNFIQDQLSKFNKLKDNLENLQKLTKQLELLDSHYNKIEKFIEIYDKDNWVFELKETDAKKMFRLTFKPIDISNYAHEYLLKMGYYVLFMSATLLSSEKFLETLGIKQEDSESLFIPSPFPVKNKPIFILNSGFMNQGSIDNTLPVLVKTIKEIIEQHKSDKGIIHTHSYKIANYLEQQLKSKRLLFANSDNKDEILKKHKNSKEPTILVSPSMTEGVDLYGEQSRFQILCKIPYPYLGDKLVSKRMHKWKWWYPFQTSKTVIQSIGRSIRSEDDYAVTYILDSEWERFYGKNKDLFPKDFEECLQK